MIIAKYIDITNNCLITIAIIFSTLLIFPCLYNTLSYADEIVSNVRHYMTDDDTVVIYYDLTTENAVPVEVNVSLDGGKTFIRVENGLSGDVGIEVYSGLFKRIEWKPEGKWKKLTDTFDIHISTGSKVLTEPHSDESEKLSVSATAATAPIRIDGILNETDWNTAEIATDFTQRELTEGAPATEKTEVRILYDTEYLYIGIKCYDSEPDKIIAHELKWDSDIEKSDDTFTVVIDTYNDKRMGFYFSVNPNGARYDATFLSGSRMLSKEWNGIWDVVSRITDQGWTAEIIIPLKTLRFPNTDTQVWGINFRRTIRRKNEEILWSGWGRNDGIRQLAKTGTLIIDESLRRSNKLEVKPYFLSGKEKEREKDQNNVFKYGLDAKIGITSNTTLDLTTKTERPRSHQSHPFRPLFPRKKRILS